MTSILAMILAGGRVDELSVLTLYRPKSAVPFGGLYRIIDFPLSNLMHSGIEKVGILSQYHSSSLINHIGIGASWDFIGRNRGAVMLPPFKTALVSDWYKGTADAVYQNLDFIQENNPEKVLLLSGDHVYKMDYQLIIDYHQQKKADLTVAFTKVSSKQAHRFGVAEIDHEDGETGGRIVTYQEKPQKPISQWASLTIYLFNTEVLIEVLQENEQIEFGRDIIPRMIDRYKVYGYKFYDYWGYTRTLKEFWQGNMELLGKSPRIDLEKWQVRTNLEHRGIGDRIPARIGRQATVENSLMYNGCVINGKVVNSILFPGVRVEKEAVVRNSIVMFDSVIKEGAVLDYVITDVNVEIGEHSHIGFGRKVTVNNMASHVMTGGLTVVGQYTVIPPATRIGRDCIIYPNLKPEDFPSTHIKSGETVK